MVSIRPQSDSDSAQCSQAMLLACCTNSRRTWPSCSNLPKATCKVTNAAVPKTPVANQFAMTQCQVRRAIGQESCKHSIYTHIYMYQRQEGDLEAWQHKCDSCCIVYSLQEQWAYQKTLCQGSAHASQCQRHSHKLVSVLRQAADSLHAHHRQAQH